MKALLSLIFLSLFTLVIFGQESSSENTSKAYGPTIGVGVGTIGFYGDLNDKNYGSPFTSNGGFNLYLIQPVTDFLNVRFNFLQSKIREEERSLQRNLNFESSLTSGSVLVEYNFSNFLPEIRKITPFVTTGFEIIEFNPKSDLLSAEGEPYNYWTDGTIRNIPENSPNSDQSEIIYRDYTYETDIRESGFNNSNTYAERAFSIPVGVGVDMHLNDQFNFRFESIFHFAFTDYIDGVSPNTSSEVVGSKPANSRNDWYYYNGISLSYNFEKVKPADAIDYEKTRDQSEKIDFLAYGNTEDYDSDGVIDLVDACPNTPKDVEVDSLGCPIDTDGDGIADYLDEEINSEYPEFANDKGISVTDEMIYRSYMQYKDSTLEFAETIERDFTGKRRKQNLYRVKVGEYNKGESPKDMSLLLSLSDLSKVDQGEKTLYTVGNYKTLPEATTRAADLKQKGFNPTDIVKRNSKGQFETIIGSTPNDVNDKDASENSSPTENENIDQVVFRVQLGAFKTKPTDAKFQKIPNLFIVEANGYYRYMSGSYTNFNDAAKHKVRMIVDGFKGSFVVAYKNGKRVSLKSVGVDSISSDPIIGK